MPAPWPEIDRGDYDGSVPPLRIANACGHLDHEPRAFPRPAERGHLDRRSGGPMVTEGPLPHLVQGRPVTLQVRGEDADADHVAELAARRAQDGVQVGEELLGFGRSGVWKLPCPRIDPEKCGHENPSIRLDGLRNRALVRGSIGGFDRSHVWFLLAAEF